MIKFPPKADQPTAGIVLSLSFAFCGLSFALNSYAEEITILYTGDSHAMIYPCNCPKEPDGGVARRSTLVKEIRKANPHALLLDSGGFFGGGVLDEYTQNTQLDSFRTKINLKAMELMRYDAVALGDDVFNFGKEFFQEGIDKTNLTFLSCNLKAGKVLPYLIKDILGTKIGIIAVSPLSANSKAGGLILSEPRSAVAKGVASLKNSGAEIIVLLSQLGESEDLNLINDIQGIDCLITGRSRLREEPFSKTGNTLILRPAWQARRLGKLSLTVEDKKIKSYKVEELPLSKLIPDDPDISAILPSCFVDSDCKREGSVGICQDPGTLDSSCLFKQANKIGLLIVTTRDCVTCANTETAVNFLKTRFPGLIVSYLYYPEQKAAKLVKELGISDLPAYLLGKEVEKEKGFSGLKANLQKKGDFYLLEPEFSGFGYMLSRKKIKGRLDLFLSLYDKNTPRLLDVIKEFNPDIHFLAVELENGFDSPKGGLEAEEYLRAVCIQKYYPQKFWDYISCRSISLNSSWWEDCAGGIELDKIKSCAKGQEGALLLRENISLNKELRIISGPTYLLDNQEIFGSQGLPSKEELRKIIKR